MFYPTARAFEKSSQISLAVQPRRPMAHMPRLWIYAYNSLYINISCGKPSSKPSNIGDCYWVYLLLGCLQCPLVYYFKYVTWFMFGLTTLTLALNWIHLSWIVKRSAFIQGIDACVGLPRIVRNHALKSSTAQWLTFWMHVMPSESPHLLLCVQW